MSLNVFCGWVTGRHHSKHRSADRVGWLFGVVAGQVYGFSAFHLTGRF